MSNEATDTLLPPTVTVTKSVTVPGIDAKPACEIVARNGEVTITLLPKNGQRRSPVAMQVLRSALILLEDDET